MAMDGAPEAQSVDRPHVGAFIVEDVPRQGRKRKARAYRRLARRRVRLFGRQGWILGLSGAWLILIFGAVLVLNAPGRSDLSDIPPTAGLVAFLFVQVVVLGLSLAVIVIGHRRRRHLDRWSLRTLALLITLFWAIAGVQALWLWSVATPQGDSAVEKPAAPPSDTTLPELLNSGNL